MENKWCVVRTVNYVIRSFLFPHVPKGERAHATGPQKHLSNQVKFIIESRIYYDPTYFILYSYIRTRWDVSWPFEDGIDMALNWCRQYDRFSRISLSRLVALSSGKRNIFLSPNNAGFTSSTVFLITKKSSRLFFNLSRTRN